MTRESGDTDALLGRLAAAQPLPPTVAKHASLSDSPGKPGEVPDVAWDDHADAIVSRATSAASLSESETAALMAAPPLRGEPGESQRGSKGVELKSVAGQEDSASTSANSVGAAAMSESERPKPSQRPASIRPSLKEMAERHSKTPPPPSVRSPTSTPLPTSVPTATPLPAGMAPVSTPLPTAASAGPASDSSPNSVAPKSVAPSSVAPSSAAPSSAAPSSAAPSNVVPMVAAKKPANDGGSAAGMGILIALAGVAVAAGLFFFMRSQPAAKSAPTADRAAVTAQVEEAKPVESAASAPAKTAEPTDGAIDIAALGDATATPENTGAAPDPAVAQHDPSDGRPAPIVKVEPDGTLHDAMEKVTGPVEEKAEPTPAAADPQPKNLPDRPPQGSVTAAVGSVMGAARACVAGGDDVSRATITFGSSGAVKSVAVSGWAAGKPASSCIQNAMKAANVGPFTQPTFTFGVTVRP